MTNPEQPVLDAIAELVDWQLEEGRRRGDGPAARPRTPTESTLAWLQRSFPVVSGQQHLPIVGA